MNGIELIASLCLVLLVGGIFGFSISKLTDTSYTDGFNDCKTQTLQEVTASTNYVNQAKLIVEDCANKAMQVIDERDECLNKLNKVGR